MKKIVYAIIAGVLLCTVSSCDPEQTRKHKVAANSYLVDVTLEGHTHQYLYYDGYYEHGPVDHWPDCKYCNGESGDYNRIKSTTDSYVNEVVELLKAKDAEIASLEEVVKTQNEQMKLHGITK